MEKFWEIQLSGCGGQGMVLAGLILAEAAVLAGKNVVQTQTYGPEARGGATMAEVIISDGEIDYPKVQQPDFLLAMSQEAFDKYGPNMKGNNRVILIDSTIVTNLAKAKGHVVALPITKIAQEEIGKSVVANMVALGALVSLTGVVPEKSLAEALRGRVPHGAEEVNIKALRLGYQAAKGVCHLCELTNAL